MAELPFRRIDRCSVPPNWSTREWIEEIRAEANAAALQAQRDFDPTRGVPLEAYVHLCVWAATRRRYRQEWTYVLRCTYQLAGVGCNALTAGQNSSADIADSLRGFLDRLPAIDRQLIVNLFWEEKTEVEVARMLGLSQQAISKRKRRILEQLRDWIGRSERRDP